MKQFLIGILLGLLLVAVLFIVRPGQAEASPQFGYRWTSNHGWIVWVDNDRYYSIRSTCSWWIGGNRWHFSHIVPAFGYRWTTSDAGSWGDRRPYNLRCSYVRSY
jgi:hypothetical protein